MQECHNTAVICLYRYTWDYTTQRALCGCKQLQKRTRAGSELQKQRAKVTTGVVCQERGSQRPLMKANTAGRNAILSHCDETLHLSCKAVDWRLVDLPHVTTDTLSTGTGIGTGILCMLENGSRFLPCYSTGGVWAKSRVSTYLNT